MIWNLDWGTSYEKIVAAAKSSGIDPTVLPCIISRTEVAEHLHFEWSAFRMLSTDRQIGMALGPIMWSSIDAFARRYRIVEDDFDRLCRIIQAMDEIYRDYSKGSD